MSEKLDLRLSGGLAVGLLDANESWTQTLTPLPGGGSATATGGGDAFETLWGYYASLDADWQINHRGLWTAPCNFRILASSHTVSRDARSNST